MTQDPLSGRLSVILHADVAGSTALVRENEQLAHARIQETFHRLGDSIGEYQGRVHELRGDALLAGFERASDAVAAALAFQHHQREANAGTDDVIRPEVRIGIALGEVVVADDTLTGAGVVIAQRLEQMAQPGGIVIQGAAYETIPERFPFAYESLGEHPVKGFDEPIRAFAVAMKQAHDLPQPSPQRTRDSSKVFPAAIAIAVLVAILLAWFRPWKGSSESSFTEALSPASADNPSVVILPFDNLSDDAAQQYFAHGITEDLTTDLSRIKDLFVVSRNSAFTYADKAVDTRQVSRELGVRYVIEGSVRRVGELLRINVQLIDGESGGHLWANRYDGAVAEVLEFQDDVIQNIVSSLSIKLDATRRQQLGQTETANPLAYDAFLQGWAHYRKFTPDDFDEAAGHFKRAIEIDPDYSRAYAALASTYWEGWERWWYKQMGFDEWIGPRLEAKKLLEIALRKPTALAHQVASEVSRQQGNPADMLKQAQQAVRLDPNDPNSYIALTWALSLGGKGQEALASADRALALDPHNPAFYLYQKGFSYFILRQYEQAADYLERALKLNPANFSARNILIPTYAYLGKDDAAKQQLEAHPLPLSIDWVGYYWRFDNPEDWDHLDQGLRLAGVPAVATKLPTPPDD